MPDVTVLAAQKLNSTVFVAVVSHTSHLSVSLIQTTVWSLTNHSMPLDYGRDPQYQEETHASTYCEVNSVVEGGSLKTTQEITP